MNIFELLFCPQHGLLGYAMLVFGSDPQILFLTLRVYRDRAATIFRRKHESSEQQNASAAL